MRQRRGRSRRLGRLVLRVAGDEAFASDTHTRCSAWMLAISSARAVRMLVTDVMESTEMRITQQEFQRLFRRC